jgi:hypothetical protein
MKGSLYISISCYYIIYDDRIAAAVFGSRDNPGRILGIIRSCWRCGDWSEVKALVQDMELVYAQT